MVGKIAPYVMKKHSKIRLFADDIILYKEIATLRDAQQLQDDLESLQLWEGTWLLKFSIPKCRDEAILLLSSPIFLSSNSFYFYLFCLIFCSMLQHFA